MKIIKRILTAMQFLTIFPLSCDEIIEPKEFSKSMAYFPFVGLLLGMFLLCIYVILGCFFSQQLTTVGVAGVWILATGALHLDGFIDTVDGICSGYGKEGILKVMEDTHCGAKGVVALIFLIILKMVLLNDISLSSGLFSLVFAPVISRWAMVFAAVFSDYARNTEGLGKSFVGNVGKKELIIASSVIFVVGIILFWDKFFVLVLPTVVITIIFIVYFKGKLGGITGDVLGALNEVIEVVFLLSFLFLGAI